MRASYVSDLPRVFASTCAGPAARRRPIFVLKRRALEWLSLVCLALVCVAPPASGQESLADSVGLEAMRIYRDIEANQIDSARERLMADPELWSAHPLGRVTLGNLAFNDGRYEEAIQLFESVDLERMPGSLEGMLRSRYELLQTTWQQVRSYEVWTSDDGLVEVRYQPGPDEVMLPWIHETLRGAWYAIGYDLGHWSSKPIRVELYERASALAQVSPLSSEAISTTGTIGLSKYNKLMVTSPRGTHFGYPWRTTLVHEYVHQVVSELTGTRVPIWLHEALAKYLEGRWTGSLEPQMQRSVEGLLARRVREDRLVTFEQMHPSMALLPSQEDSATAYAQVFTLVEAMVERRGRGVLRELMDAINEEDTIEEAVAAVMGEPFDVFYARWWRDLRQRPWRDAESDYLQEIVLREQSSQDSHDRWAEVDDVEARDFLRLGELLRARDAHDAALVEYQKAELLMGSGHPILQSAIASIYLERGDHEAALAALDSVTEDNPDIYRLHLQRGTALNGLSRHDEARDALIHALGINPFDPRVFSELSTAYRGLGEDELADRAADSAARVL